MESQAKQLKMNKKPENYSDEMSEKKLLVFLT